MKKTVQIFMRITFVVYCLVLFKLLFLELRLPFGDSNFNLIPFRSIAEYISRAIKGTMNVGTSILNVGGNLIAFFPMGCYLPCLFKSFRKPKVFYPIILAVLIAVESLQFAFKIGIFDIDDIILNFAGAVLGYILVISPKFNDLLKKIYVLCEYY